MENKIIYLDGKPSPKLPEEACCYVAAPVDAKGNWQGPSEITSKYFGFRGARADRVKKKLPFSISSLIETKGSKGSRIPLERILSKR